MAGSHRAERSQPGRSSVPSWAVVAAVVLALVPAAWFAAQRVFSSGPTVSPTASHTTDLPIPAVSPSRTQTQTQTPSASPTPTKAPVKLTRVAPDAPRRIVSGKLIDAGFDSAVTALEPASATEVARWESRGSPGSPGTDTVFVVGKVFTDGDSAFADLPRLERGAKVSIRTDAGTMTYTVRVSALEARSALRHDPLVTTHAPGRLVLVGIRYGASGDSLDRAIVVTAELTGAKKA